jgi:hypothetical protein
MGLGRSAQWLLGADADTEAQLAERARLLDERRAEVVQAVPGAEATAALLEHVGRLVQDDLCLLDPDERGTYRLTAAVLCFPSHWRLGDKIGHPVAAIHAPVPHYDVELAAKIDTFLSRLKPGMTAVRRNWMIHDREDLFAPERPAANGAPPTEWWLRSERQALHRFEAAPTILFTIRTQQVQISDLAARPHVATALARRIATEPDDLSEYRFPPVARAPLVAALTAIGRP